MARSSDNIASQTVREAALAWFVRINSGDATVEDRQAFERWLADDAAHRREYEKLAGIWSSMDGIDDPRRRQPARRALLSRRVFLGGAATLTLAGGLFALNGVPDFIASDHYTGTSELKSLTLADGSIVDLDADSALSVDYTPAARRLFLRRGRAFFKVAKDASRPFIVEAAGGRTTALGTEFVVHMTDDDVIVAVEESAVSVTPAPGAIDTRLQAGESASYQDGRISAAQGETLAAETAWRRGKLIFNDQPLRRVINDVNRYRRGTIRILDKRLLSLRVSGIFDIRNPDGVLDAITGTLPVRATELTPYLVLLRPA
ncbi:sensor [Brucella endophytica]|uniref:Sensor n=1 Tax=Brucella endophytica TaxID=1963359 RepID=A0A916WIE3_9HYPH|nr:FecR family protein [Brucella endophytica]GGB02891.1 sensor [Brucella endophytica]